VLEEHAADLDVRQAIGVAGTITTIAALELGGYDRDRVHGYRIAREAAERQLERLAALPLEERRRLPGLEPARAPVIVAGAAIVVEVLRCFDLDELEVSENDILTGAALAAAELPEREEGDAPPGAYTCC
jgi:exopolyphosphatase/guanosine-5'-triphosphate,3'-diphosphate pyrophosphatase